MLDTRTYVLYNENTETRSGRTIVIYYSGPHFIDGLDSAAGTTIPDTGDEALTLGAAGYALLSHGVNRSEANVIESRTLDDLQALAQKYLAYFRGVLSGKRNGLRSLGFGHR